MMKILPELHGMDFPDTEYEPDGYDMKSMPKATTTNFNILIEHHNKLVEQYNLLLVKIGIVEDE